MLILGKGGGRGRGFTSGAGVKVYYQPDLAETAINVNVENLIVCCNWNITIVGG